MRSDDHAEFHRAFQEGRDPGVRPVYRIVSPEGLPEPVGFSHAVDTNGDRTLYVAGQTGHRADGSIPASLVDQFRSALVNVSMCLEAAASHPNPWSGC